MKVREILSPSKRFVRPLVIQIDGSMMQLDTSAYMLVTNVETCRIVIDDDRVRILKRKSGSEAEILKQFGCPSIDD